MLSFPKNTAVRTFAISTVSAASLALAGAAFAGNNDMGEKVMLDEADTQANTQADTQANTQAADPSATVAQEPTYGAAQDTADAAESDMMETMDAAAQDASDTTAAALDITAPVDVVETAMAAEGFDTLVAALQAADLVETLKGDGPFTVFAPTDDAFAALPEGTLDDLLLPENKDKLVSILTFHVLPGAVMSGDLEGDMSVPSVQGEEIAISVSDAGVTVNGASVLAADIAASNGVIHVIDSVILPQEAGKSR